MGMNHNKSSVGDWLFLGAGMAAIGCYFAYENAADVAVWLQSITNVPIIPASGLLAFLISHWGLVLLVAAIIFAVFKLWINGTTSTAGDGSRVNFRRYKSINVNLVR